MEEIGIAIQAKKNLQAIFDSIDALDKIDTHTKKVIGTLKDLSKGSTDVAKLEKAYSSLEKEIEKVQKTSGKASKEQIAQWQEQQRHLSTAIKGLKIAQKEGISDYDVQVRTAMANVEAELKRPDLSPEARRSIETLLSESRMIPKGEKVRLGMVETGFQRAKQEMTQLATKDEDVLGSLTGMLGPLGKIFTVAGIGTIIYKSAKHWLEVDDALKKVEARFGNIRDIAVDFGRNLGISIRESTELGTTYGRIMNNPDWAQMTQYVGFARATGMRDLTGAFPLALGARYVGGMPNTQRYLTGFQRLAERTGMGRGRVEELIGVTSQLMQAGAQQRMGLDVYNLMGMQLGLSRFWQGADDERGRGAWGMNFMQRLNQSMLNYETDSNKGFYMRAYGFGRSGITLPSVIERMEAGIFGQGNLEAILTQLDRDLGRGRRTEKLMALHGLFGGEMKMMEVKRLYDVWEEQPEKIKAFTESLENESKLRKELIGEAAQNFEKLGTEVVSTKERLQRLADAVPFEAMESFGGLVKILSGPGGANEALRQFSTSLQNVKRELETIFPGMFSRIEERGSENVAERLSKGLQEEFKDLKNPYTLYP